tara:strand:- start:401 stop:997 length:597 start_codon:yes stop_codon:yes gene_type:complete
MIILQNINESQPYNIFTSHYQKALDSEESNVEAASISSFNINKNEVSSRYVNIKLINDDKWIFFTNYHSPKALSFSTHKQIACLFYWRSTNTQIRIKALIKKTSVEFNQYYFSKRKLSKNALAISSNQSDTIVSYEQIKKNYNETLKNADLKKCPKYWGGFSFTPYYFEFWEGHESRVNKREVFDKIDGDWSQSFLQP